MGVRSVMEKSILNFHFDYLNPSLKTIVCLMMGISCGPKLFIENEDIMAALHCTAHCMFLFLGELAQCAQSTSSAVQVYTQCNQWSALY